MLLHTGLQYSQECRCSILCDCVHHNRHTWRTCMGQHTSHSRIALCLGNLGPEGTHTVGNSRRGSPGGSLCMSRLPGGFLARRQHSAHIADRDRGPGILDQSMLPSAHIHCHCDIQLGEKRTHLQAVQKTFRYKAVLTLSADLVGVANEASPAATGCSVTVHLAHSIHAACQGCARILTFLLDAGKMIRTFRITGAFRSRGCCEKSH